MKHIFIVNPMSGSHQSQRLIPFIEAYFKQHGGAYTIHLTKAVGHAQTLAQQVDDPEAIVYVVGGDGTANEVLKGLRPEVGMAIIPSGTGNDFFRMLKLPAMPVEDLIVQTIEGKMVQVDYVLANGQRYLNCFSIGFDADIGIMADQIKQKVPWLSPLAYGLATMFKLLSRKNQSMTLKFGQQTHQTNSLMIAVMNGQFYGGGFKPTPAASIQDGLLDVCVVENTHLLNVLRVLPKYLKGTHTHESIVKFFQVKKLRLESPVALNAQTDGEGMRCTSQDFEVVPQGLKLRVPNQSQLEGIA